MIERDGMTLREDAVAAGAIFCIDPFGVGGVALRSAPGPIRDRWLDLLRASFPNPRAIRRVPLNAGDDRLLGGLDLAASLRAGCPVADKGLLVEADGGALILAMSERLEPAAAARLTAVVDSGEVRLQRDGLALRTPSRFGVIALDEGIDEEERPPEALLDRLGVHLDLSLLGVRDDLGSGFPRSRIAAARRALPDVDDPPGLVEALCRAAAKLGIGSFRAVLFALRSARAAAALGGRRRVARIDVERAARLVLAPRTRPFPEESTHDAEPDDTHFETLPEDPPEPHARDETPMLELSLDDIVVAACRAALPLQLLQREALAAAGRPRSPPRTRGRLAGRTPGAAERGRPTGVCSGKPKPGLRIDLVATLRAAAPFQRIRRRDRSRSGAGRSPAIRVAAEDLRITRRKPRLANTTLFVVDASGSTALHRLGEAKGAVELLLAESYIRRDRVALIAFRQMKAEIILPPTRSLARAKRLLAGLPGGGATPLAAGIDAAVSLAESLDRKGESPISVFMTDGRANIALDGTPGRTRARADAIAAARCMRAAGYSSAFVDTSPRPSPDGAELARAMGARYVALPHVDARSLLHAVHELSRDSA